MEMIFLRKIFSLVFLFFASSAFAVGVTCTQNGSAVLGGSVSGQWIIFGSCTPTGSYTASGEVFDGTGTDQQNAQDKLCGSLNAIIKTSVFSGGAGFHVFFDQSTFKVRIQGIRLPALTASRPTFTVTKGAILALSELGLSADAATATVNNNIIASTLELTTNSPVGIPTVNPGGAQGTFEDVVVATDTHTAIFDFVSFCANP